MKEEKIIKGSVDMVNISCTKKILNQMINCICKIKIKGANGTGFFCTVPFDNNNNKIKVLITNYHVLNDKYCKENKEINLLLNDDNEAVIINLDIERITYFNEEYDITIIELKEIDKIKEYIELDDNIFKNNEQIFYEEKSIYVIQYANGKNACVSYGLLTGMDKYNIIHKCSTDNGSSGSPILNLENNKVIGIHKHGFIGFNFNEGTLLKFPLNDFIQKNKNIKDNKQKDINQENLINMNNFIIGEINVEKDDINKNIQIINSFEELKSIYKWKDKDDDFKYENEKEIKENIVIKINGKIINFSYYYIFEKEGKYKIEYIFKNNLTKTDFMFAGCKSLTNLNLSNFNTQNITNMSGMFYYCKSLTNLNLSNFNTQNVTNMSYMFGGCKSLTNLNLSNFNTQNVTNMRFMFYVCESLASLNLSNFNTQNVIYMDWMFYGCNSLTKKNIITKDNKILKIFENK